MKKSLFCLIRVELLLPTLFVCIFCIVWLLRLLRLDVPQDTHSFLFAQRGVYTISGVLTIVPIAIDVLMGPFAIHESILHMITPIIDSAATNQGTNADLLIFFILNLIGSFVIGYIIRGIIVIFPKVRRLVQDMKKPRSGE